MLARIAKLKFWIDRIQVALLLSEEGGRLGSGANGGQND
jgi:hypothetical protein